MSDEPKQSDPPIILRQLGTTIEVGGRQVDPTTCEAATRGMARLSCLIQARDTEEVFAYDPVPLKVVGTARVRYHYAGRIEPLPYPIDN